MTFLKEKDFEFVLKNPEAYNNLLNAFIEADSFRGYLYAYNERVFYISFRLWLEQKYKCYNDGTCFLYFKAEEDYIWVRLKYG